MRVLIIGGDGRAHALAWKLLNSPQVREIVCAPGNGGTAPLTATADLDTERAISVARFCFDELFDLILPADSATLLGGLAEEALSLQVGVCGAPARTAALERSRCRAKEFMVRHGLPTAPGRALDDLGVAEKYLAAQPMPVIIKADHPDGGEHAYHDRYAALEGLRAVFAARPLDADRGGVVIESLLSGPRVSISAFTDGRTAVPLQPTRIYDRVDEGDSGPQAAGVGAHTSASAFSRQLGEFLHRRFLAPVLAGLAEEALPCWGIVGVDCIVTADGPRMTGLRFSLREGEAQVVLPRLEGDLLPWVQAMMAGRLHELPPPVWAPTPTVGLGLFARGYPVSFPYGGLVRGVEELDEGVMAFHSQTAHPAAVLPYSPQRPSSAGGLNQMVGRLFGMGGASGGSGLHSTGGLVLTVVASGATLAGARGRAIVNAERIQFDARAFRSDIGAKEFG